MNSSLETLKTNAGIEICVGQKELNPNDALEPIYSAIDQRKGVILSSGFDYPGRHSRWDLGFIDPAIEFVSRQRKFRISALHEQGQALVPLFKGLLQNLDCLRTLVSSAGELRGELYPQQKHIAEEERSRQPSIFVVLRTLLKALCFDHPLCAHAGFYGAFGYDLIHQFETLELKLKRDADAEDCHLYFPLDLTVVDRKREDAYSVNFSLLTPSGHTKDIAFSAKPLSVNLTTREDASSEIESDHAPGQFAEKVRKVIEGTRRGDYFEVVLSQTFSTSFEGKATDLFRRLAKVNPSPYMFLLNLGPEQLVGSSPEIYARVTGRRYETCPIAGTVPRGQSALEDADQVRELLGSEKDESELTMCTDVDRNDMARVCVPGSVKIIGRRQLEFYSHLIHTVDHVEGQLAEQFDSLDAFQTHMWACTVTGSPKPAALQEIENLEASPRGWYSGAIGAVLCNGDLNTGITLRTAVLRDGKASIRAGATLLYGSDPELEEQETRTKAAAFLSALAKLDQPLDEVLESKEKAVTPLSKRRVLLVDYRDSFVHNLASYLREIGLEVVTLRSGFPLELLEEIKPEMVLLSPGPGAPQDFQMSELIGALISRAIPIFGVCLGHQGLAQHFGAELGQLDVPFHGKCSQVIHGSSGIFSGIESPFEVGRYHSLYVKEESVPNSLEIIARTENTSTSPSVIMAMKHKSLPIASVQFHPESLMTLKNKAGHRILRNFVQSL